MRKIAIAGLVIAAVASAAPGARAGSDSEIIGGCSFMAVAADYRPMRADVTGEIDVEAVVYSPTAGSNPVSAMITCEITVNGVAQPSAAVTASGTVAVVGGAAVTYRVGDDDVVQLCQSVDYTAPGDNTPTDVACFKIHTFPPWWLVWDAVEPCPVFAALAGMYGPVFVNSQGDVYIDGEPWFDCPPYDIEWD